MDGSVHSARSARVDSVIAAFERALLGVASEVEADETRLKREVLDAARNNDCDRVISIVEDWIAKPPAEVLAANLIDVGGSR